MRVFVTGATGYVGSAVVKALVRAGHEVSGLARSAAKGAEVEELGAKPVRGELGALARVGEALRGYDAWVHTAIDYGLGPAADREAVEALLSAARSATRPVSVVYTSGVWVLGETRGLAGESAPSDHPSAAVAWRPAHERLVLDAATPSLAAAVVRPGMVYGERRGLLTPWFAQARQGGPQVVGTGQNRWAFVHREDLAELYRLVVEQRARGIFHGVDGVPLSVKDAAGAASAAVGGAPVRLVPVEEARKTMGPMADALAVDQEVAAPRAAELGWKPRRRSFVAVAKESAAEYGG